jgi:hypothetical protein
LYLDEERGGAPPLASSTTALCTDCGGPLSGASSSASGPPLPSRDEGDGSSSSTNNDESELSASTLADELKAVQARQQMYAYRDDDRLAMAKSGLNGEWHTQRHYYPCCWRYSDTSAIIFSHPASS